ncbi:MAG: glycosyltransferase [Gemmatimonadaceae bacterium]|nr:glycosyltransferase [Gemmatimonadaceae bacterium]
MRTPGRTAPRILFVTHNVPRAAGDIAGSFVLRLAVALQAAGARVDIIAPGAPGLAPHDTLEGVRIDRVRYASDARMTLAYTGTMAEAVQGSWSGRFALLQLLWHLRRATQHALRAAATAGDPYTVVHAHWWFPAALALKGALPAETPLVITMHGSDVRLAEKKPVAHPLMRAVLTSARVSTAVSSWLADAAHRIAPAAKIAIAPMPVDDRLFADHADDDARHGVLFVGRLNAQKGLADLLEAMADARLATERLTIVGEGPDRTALEQQAARLGLTDRLTWLGVLTPSMLVARYREAAVVAMPSRNEGLGLVAVEAQLSGTPVVAYAEGGLLDVVRPEHGGTLVTAGDRAALATALARLLHDPAACVQAGLQGRVFVQSRFTPDAVAARYLALYAEATS